MATISVFTTVPASVYTIVLRYPVITRSYPKTFSYADRSNPLGRSTSSPRDTAIGSENEAMNAYHTG